MDSGIVRIELTGLGRLYGLARLAGDFTGGPEESASGHFRSGLVWLTAVLIAGFGAWMLLSGYASKPAESEPARLLTVAATEPATDASRAEAVSGPATIEAITPEQPPPVDGLTISSQSWRRGGLGSNAVFTFKLRNGNDYAVRDIEISCAFARRDGSHLTDRMRIIHDIVNEKSRKTLAGVHVGLININAAKAKCSLVAASRI